MDSEDRMIILIIICMAFLIIANIVTQEVNAEDDSIKAKAVGEVNFGVIDYNINKSSCECGCCSHMKETK